MNASAHDQFFSWAACDGDGRGTCGVTADRQRAVALLGAALDVLGPGASGFVRLVRLDRYARQPSYIHGSTLLILNRDGRPSRNEACLDGS